MTSTNLSDRTAPTILTPGPPFCDPAADLILRSSDDIEFHVHRVVLSLLSPVFQDMFTFPQPASEPEIPEVGMSESGDALDRALRFCYPGAEPSVETLAQLCEILDILLHKYDMQSIVPVAKLYLTQHLDTNPLGSFAVAARYNWDELASVAAKKCLGLPLRAPNFPTVDELRYVSGKTYDSLLQYHNRCAETARLAIGFHWLPPLFDSFLKAVTTECQCKQYHVEFSMLKLIVQRRNDHRVWNWIRTDGRVPVWLGEYLHKLQDSVFATPLCALDEDELLAEVFMLGFESKCSRCQTAASLLPIYVTTQLWPKIKEDVDRIKFALEF
ncbi:hypothetical protein B0H15DRAFT_805465 [Mycena belliarum]|uniref:BTB domain-containing protein n=1 Tax=Mycena belliarum TaxID=1033014 RepID=A0AAD6TUB9_9AGAR|nr:hypothetical protein B0H15DRAFT_805465 [Mycena belliae]